mmetsp:Transcript_24206/g.23783  ORF Transcript_24206/g.23783 Transcript_24206/m.23783 type:complete len:167 (+) Transcript_24206:973-1473(+)
MITEVGGPLQIGVYKMSGEEETLQEERNKYKLGKKLPVLKFYKNGLLGSDKMKKAYQILSTYYDSFLEELHEGMDHNIKEVNERILSNMAISGAQEGKFVVIYYYEDEFTSLDYKAISSLRIFRDDFVFLSFSNPSEELVGQLGLKGLPGISGILPAEDDNDDQLK